MMICNADFDDLFPSLFPSKGCDATVKPYSPSAQSLARWVDDGGSVPLPVRQAIPSPHRHSAAGGVAALSVGFAFALMQANMANAMAKTMLRTYGRAATS